MSETSNRKALIGQLLSDRDAEFRRAVKAERQLKELSDVKRMQADYEARLAEKDKAIQERDRALESKENRIAQLEQKLLYLERKMWGTMSEKRRIPDDPNQLKLDFGLLEMTPEEEETVRKAIKDKFAPAWKTLEFMTLGEMVHLFKSVKNEDLKLQIANQFGIKKLVTFENYLELVKDLRNTCAHGNVLYDFTPERSIRKGPAMKKGIGENQNLNGALRIVLFMMKQISENRYNDLIKEIDALILKYSEFPVVKRILSSISGLDQLHRE